MCEYILGVRMVSSQGEYHVHDSMGPSTFSSNQVLLVEQHVGPVSN